MTPSSPGNSAISARGTTEPKASCATNAKSVRNRPEAGMRRWVTTVHLSRFAGEVKTRSGDGEGEGEGEGDRAGTLPLLRANLIAHR